jgi:hypothetical protein
MSPTSLSRVEEAVRAVVEYTEAFNRHDVEGILRLLSEDCILEDSAPAPEGARCSGKQDLRRLWTDYFLASPDARLEVEELFGLGLRCVLRWNRVWTDADGAKRHLRGAEVFKVRNGLICEWLSYAKAQG